MGGKLNTMQMEACCYIDGPLLILAGAGSGKTRVITHRIAYLIEDCDVNPYNILAITFTNKAAREMRERVDQLVGYGSEHIWVSTFHSMCVRILRRHIDKLNPSSITNSSSEGAKGFTTNFTIYDTDEQKSLLKEIIRYFNLDPKMYSEKAMISAISKAKEDFLSPDLYEKRNMTNFRGQQIAKVYREYQKRLRLNNALDFDDLIYKTIELFQFNPDVLEIYQKRFQHIMVDEYQDTNHTQFLLVKMLAAKYRNLCVVGDDDQSIYKFRGANVKNILNFEDEYPDAKVVKLEQNYRSTANILNAANGVIANNPTRKDKTLWTKKEEGEKVQFSQFDSEFTEAEYVIKLINRKVEEGASLNDIAILYRTNNQSRVLEEKLIFASTPYGIVGGTNFYSRKEIKDIVSYFKLVANDADDIAFSRIINVPRRGIGDTTVGRVREYAMNNDISMYEALKVRDDIPGLGKAKEKLGAFYDLIEEFKGFVSDPDDESLVGLFDAIMDKTGYRDELKNEGTDEAQGRLENLLELKNKIAKYEEEAERADLNELLEDIALVADTDANEADEINGRVTLMTLHSAKGLEFPYVFMVGMEDGLFPSFMSLNSGDIEDLYEERRLCYVGITRAEKELYLSASRSRMVNGVRQSSKISRFVEEIPENLITKNNVFDSYSGTSRSYGGSITGGYSSYSRNNSSSNTYSRNNSGSKPDALAYSKTMASITKGMPTGNLDLDYKVGDTVKHIKFGKGEVLEMKSTGSDYEVVINFEAYGRKKLFASLAKLKKV